MRLEISQSDYMSMLSAAQKAAPFEACGLLAGQNGKVFKFYELTNADASPEHFSMIPAEQFAALKDMRANRIEMLAAWHSHPATPARMSAEDLRLAYAPSLIHVILSLAIPDKPQIRAFTVEEGSAREIDLTITGSESEGKIMNKSIYELPAALAADIDGYEGEVQKFLSGEMPAAILKAKRVPRGVYEQRKDGTYMVRVRVTAGILTSEQVLKISELSSTLGDGILHITTRQDVQLHGICIQDTPKVMRSLLEVDLTTKGGGGNTVRNVTACPYAGVCSQECCDVTESAHAVTAYLIELTGSYNLPRKYKISFSGCRADCGLAQISDLGFVAEIRNGQPGFRVFVAGGMGATSRIASLLLEWTPAEEVIRIAESIRRLFDRYGDRKNKNRARLRFVIHKLGEKEFHKVFHEEMERVTKEGVPPSRTSAGVLPDLPDRPSGVPGLQESQGVQFLEQRQKGWVTVPLHLQFGLISSDDFTSLARLASQFSAEHGLRTTRAQGLQMRFVKTEDLPLVIAELRRLKTDFTNMDACSQRFISCAGAATCRLGLCLSRNAVAACVAKLRSSGLNGKALDGFMVHVNGCPNACGHQPIAPIGFSGSAQRVGGRLMPFYRVTMGGRCNSRDARFGFPIGQIPAKALPGFITELAGDFAQRRAAGEDFTTYFDRTDRQHFVAILGRHRSMPSFEDRPDFYQDFGSDEPFSLAGRGAGECGSGVFELIEDDLAIASKAIDPFDILLPTCRSLLITRGTDSGDPDSVFRNFEEYFVNTGLVSEEFRPLLLRARGYVQGWKEALQTVDGEPARLLERVKLLFSTLDANLQFHPPEKETPASDGQSKSQSAPASETKHELNLRGVACPMNFVKAKLKLETINTGDVLEIVLDDGQPIQNVPASFRAEGQEIAGMSETADGHWRVAVRKIK